MCVLDQTEPHKSVCFVWFQLKRGKSYDMGSSGTKIILFLLFSHGDDEKAEGGAVGEDFVGFSSFTEAADEVRNKHKWDGQGCVSS